VRSFKGAAALGVGRVMADARFLSARHHGKVVLRFIL
jgi:hypothetical protein